MNIKIVFSLIAVVVLFGCSKPAEAPDDPTVPVVSFYKAVTAGDSAGIVNSFAASLRQQLSSPTDTLLKTAMNSWQGNRAELAIKEVVKDTSFPNMAKVYIKVTFTGTETRIMDSVYLIVFKEEGGWKLGTFNPIRDRKS
jgi:hypothetical protein